ncbi:hypothetical protein AHAS_Ahas16G0217000 [Arachis hypogaea]
MVLERTRKSPYIYLAIGSWKISNCKEEGQNDEHNTLLPQVSQLKETILHALRDYPQATTVWGKLIQPSTVMRFLTTTLEEWIELNLS